MGGSRLLIYLILFWKIFVPVKGILSPSDFRKFFGKDSETVNGNKNGLRVKDMFALLGSFRRCLTAAVSVIERCAVASSRSRDAFVVDLGEVKADGFFTISEYENVRNTITDIEKAAGNPSGLF